VPGGNPVCCEGMWQDSEGRDPPVNVVSSGRQKRPSKLLDALRSRAQGTGTGHLGFGNVPAPAKRRPAILASLSSITPSTIEAIERAGVDGIELVVRKQADLEAIRSALPGLSVPLGIVLDTASGWIPSDAGNLPDIDWVRLSVEVSAAVLAWEKPARFVSIPEDLDVRRAPAFNLLEVDAFLLDGTWVNSGELSIEDALRLAALAEIFKKPVILNVGKGLSTDLVAVSKQWGINGLLYELNSAGEVAAMATYIKDLEADPSDV
jgi:hypothetical protein